MKQPIYKNNEQAAGTTLAVPPHHAIHAPSAVLRQQ
jgi:hypothetical protein